MNLHIISAMFMVNSISKEISDVREILPHHLVDTPVLDDTCFLLILFD